MLKKTILSISCAMALGAGTVPAHAVQKYFLVVPVKHAVQAPEPKPEVPISISLSSANLPNAVVDRTYNYSLREHLSVTGDAELDLEKVSWSSQTALPDGLELQGNGTLVGIPVIDDEGVSISVEAVYRDKAAQQTYHLHPSDPHYSKVTLLMTMDGEDGQTTFTEAKGHQFSAEGAAVTSTASSRFGGASARFGSRSYLKTPYSADFVFNADFTVELWANISAHDRHGGLIAAAANGWAGWQIIFDGITDRLRFEGSGSTSMVSSAALPLNAWAHIALVRAGSSPNNLKLYLNGVEVATTTFTGRMDSGNAPLHIGAERLAASFVTGFIDEVRITKDLARYTANFTPSKVTFPSR